MRACRRTRAALTAYLEDELGLERQFELEEHARHCPACAELLHRGETLDELLAELPGPAEDGLDVEASLKAIHARLDREPERDLRPFRRRLPVRTLAAVAAALLLLLSGWAWWSGSTGADLVPAGDQLARVETPRAKELVPEPVAEVEPEPERSDMNPERSDVNPERSDASPERSDASPERSDVNPERSDASPERSDANPERIDMGERAGPRDNGTELLAAVPDSDLDRSRLEACRAEVRESLRSEAELLVGASEDRTVEVFAARLDERFDALADGGWPVLRLVEDALEGDALTAKAAACYLGKRGDPITVRALRRALDRREVRQTAAQALCDLGPGGFEVLQGSVWEPELRPLVLAGLEALPAAEAADWILAAFEAVRGTPPDEPTGELLSYLAGLGAPGTEALFALAEDSRLDRSRVAEALVESPGTPGALLRRLDRLDGAGDTAFHLELVARLRLAGVASWVEKMALEGEHAPAALATLSQLEELEALRALFRLAPLRRDFGALYGEPWRAAIERSPERARDLARELVDLGRSWEAGELLEELVLAETPAAVPAALVLVQSSAIPRDLRERALLALGDLAGGEQAAAIAALAAVLERPELCAAALWSSHAAGGEQACLPPLSDPPLRASLATVERVRAIFADGGARTSSALTLFKLARELEPLLEARGDDPRTEP